MARFENNRNRSYPYGFNFHRNYSYGDYELANMDREQKVKAARGGHFGKGPKNYRRSDASILDEANEALYESYEVDATNIEVEVKDGIITLTGTVRDRQSKKEAEDSVENINGVVDVRNELRLAPVEDTPLMNSDLITESRWS